ncbi:FtsX-like permease family protein [Pseudoalteromonas xiamenensis]|uniref:ABC transporter permease n=1 Tax=Pseudoalteromonas xiamenensis TaxID=882626 RepID=UPI0035EF2C1E
MIANYAKTAWRTLSRYKQHSMLNVAGLAIGLAATLLVAQYARYELSYDKQQPDVERVFRVESDFSALGVGSVPSANYELAKAFQALPQVEDVFSLTPVKDVDESWMYVTRGENQFKLDKLFLSYANIRQFIALDVISGDLERTLSTPRHLALSQSEAYRLFGSELVVGETLSNQAGLFTVGAVFKDLPETSHFAFNSLLFMDNLALDSDSSLDYVYVKVHFPFDKSALEAQLFSRYAFGEDKKYLKLQLMPLKDLYFSGQSPYEMKPGGSLLAIQICLSLCFILLVVAIVNFINLSVAQGALRAKEIGVRKALGATRGQLFWQFMMETSVITLVAMCLGYALVELSLPLFNSLVDRQIEIFWHLDILAVLIAMTVMVTLLAGSYPAWYLSAQNTKAILQGESVQGRSAIRLRKGLLIIQSSFAIGLVIAAMVLPAQLAYLQAQPTGYEKEQKLVLQSMPNGTVFTQTPSALVEQLAKFEGVRHVGIVDSLMTEGFMYSLQFTFADGFESAQSFPGVGTGFGAVETLGLNLLAGRDFDKSFASDWFHRDESGRHVSILITRSLAKTAGYDIPELAINKTIKALGINMHIVGVVEDVQLGQTREAHTQVVFLCGFSMTFSKNLILTVVPGEHHELFEQIRALVAVELNIYEPNLFWLDEEYAHTFAADTRLANIVQVFSLLAIFLAALGTYGLASFSILRRQKELAIRKVLGAGRFGITLLVAKEFVTLVLLSAVLAFPLAFWLLDNWLSQFNHRVEQTTWMYVLALVVVSAVTWLTVSLLTLRTLSVRPSTILKYE